jgi:hypothetical protein
MRNWWRTGALLSAALVAVVAGAAPRDTVTATSVTERQSLPKPTGPIAVDYHLTSLPVTGRPLDIVITARSSDAVGLVLEASVTEPAALVIAAQTAGLDRDGARTWVVTVVPLLADVGYLDVLVAGEIDGTAQARSVVIPIRTAATKARAAVLAGLAVDSGGEALILLPVEESP